MSATDLDKLKQSLLQQNIKYLLPSYVDMHGVPKTKMVPIAHLERMMGGSELFTGAALDGVVRDEHGAAVANAEVFVLPSPMYMIQAFRQRDLLEKQHSQTSLGFLQLDLCRRCQPYVQKYPSIVSQPQKSSNPKDLSHQEIQQLCPE